MEKIKAFNGMSLSETERQKEKKKHGLFFVCGEWWLVWYGHSHSATKRLQKELGILCGKSVAGFAHYSLFVQSFLPVTLYKLGGWLSQPFEGLQEIILLRM